MLKLISKLRKFFLEKVFLKNVLMLVGGTAIGQGLLFVASPLISRMYSPEEFGIWSLIKSLVAISSSIICFRYESSVVLPEKDEDASNLFIGSITIAVAISSISFAGLNLYGSHIARLTSSQAIISFIWLIPLMMLVTGVYQSMNFWSTRRKNFKYLSLASIIQVLAMLGIQIVLPTITGYSTTSFLIFGAFVGQISSVFVLSILIWKEDVKTIIESFSLKLVSSQLWKYKNFPLYVAPYGFFSAFQQQSIILLLSEFATTKDVGLYGFSNSLVKLPISLVASALNQVFFPQVAQKIASGEIEVLVNKILKSLAIFTTPVFCIFILNTQDIFRIVFGNKWIEGGVYAVWLGLMAYMFLFTTWLDRIYDVLGNQRLSLTLEIIYDILSIAVFAISLKVWNQPILSVAIFSITTILYNFVWLAITLSLAEIDAMIIWDTTKISVCIFCFYFTLNYICRIFVSTSLEYWLLGINTLFTIGYYLIAIKKSRDLI